MTPKEKASELVNRYFNSCIGSNQFGEFTYSQIEPFIKRCALIAVDEILIIQQGYAGNRDEFKTYLDYWQEVKRQIEEL